jgi:hypothetical protein
MATPAKPSGAFGRKCKRSTMEILKNSQADIQSNNEKKTKAKQHTL